MGSNTIALTYLIRLLVLKLSGKRLKNHNRESYTHTANTVTVSGWNATDASLVQPYHILILFDSTVNREVKRIRVYNTARNDVARAYPTIWTANNSGFTGSFSNVNLQAGYHYSLISRYSANPLANTYYKDKVFSLFTMPGNNQEMTFDQAARILEKGGFTDFNYARDSRTHDGSRALANGGYYMITYPGAKG